jgi:outer membrane autotransporter protein
VGDIALPNAEQLKQKYIGELNGVTRICSVLDEDWMLELWKEFEEKKTKEAAFVYKMDKLQAVMQSRYYSELIDDNSLFKEFYDNAITRRDNREAWLRPYVTFEEVDLKNGPKVDNIAYGTYLGTNSPVRRIGNGWDGAWGFYVGYNGSKQKFQSTNVYQNGGTLGVTGELYRRNFFTGLTVNAGAGAGKAHTIFGNDDFSMMTAGVASKSGYNFEFKGGKFILQPTLLLGYSFVNTFDYTNSAGVRISSDPIHALQLEPGVRFIANLGNGWRPYMGVSMICNFFDKAKYRANDVSLPETSIKPFVRYGLGIQKTISDRFSSYGQAYVTNGGRTGIGLQAGISYVY